MIIPDAWRDQIQWYEEVAEATRKRWFRGPKLFDDVGRTRIHRQYFPGFSTTEVGSIELHDFTDASEEAYACSANSWATIVGKARITLVMAKAIIAPHKSLSIPRLELKRALRGGRLAEAVKE